MFKLQICCLVISLFIAAIYYNTKRVKSYSHIIFSLSLLFGIINIVFDMITVYTVTNVHTVSPLINRVVHDIFLGSMIMEVFLFYAYSVVLIYEEKTDKKRLWFTAIPVWISWICLVALPMKYRETPQGNYSWGPAVNTVHSIIVLYTACIVIKILKHHKDLNPKKRNVIEIAFLIESVVLVFQSLIPTALISSMGITLINLAFFLTVESPEVLLMERLREEKERADYANEAKSMFLSNMSHEIRTPMNAIVGMTDILLREDVPENMREYLNNIKNSGDALLTIINDILDFSKIESGKLEIIEEKYEPMSMLHDLAMIFLNRIGDKPVELLYDITPDLPARMYGDSQRLRQIIINLVNNAIKFTESGYVRLKVESKPVGLNGMKLVFSVEDTGMGIREEDLDKLFGSFQQVDTKKNYKKEGTGLGLAISKNLVELMNGEISVESTYGKGSIFTFYIVQKVVDPAPATRIKISKEKLPRIGQKIENPVVMEQLKKLSASYGIECVDLDNTEGNDVDYIITDNRANVSDIEKSKVCILQNPMLENMSNCKMLVVNKPLYSLNFCQIINQEEQIFVRYSEHKFKFTAPDAQVLVVDDNDMNLKVAKGLMAPYKMHIDTAKDGEDAVKMVQEKHYDIVFMDHMMPGMDGIEATIAIRNLQGEYYKKLPIIALSANATADAKEMFAQADMDDFVPKPIREKELEACLRKWIPEELQVESHEEEANTETDTESSLMSSEEGDKNIKIQCLDMVEGIKNCGSKEFLMELIGDFWLMIDSKSAKIKQLFEEGNIRDYTVEVHALKNNARMVGATKLSEMFYEMEQLGNEEKVAEIGNKLPKLLEFYNSYKKSLEEFAPKQDAEEKVKVSGEQIKETLTRLHDAVDGFDLDAADEAMKELDTYELPEELKPMLEQLRISVTDVAMEEIMEITQKMCDLC